MISFYPGPSRVYDDIPQYIQEAHRSGVLSMNHRSPEFEDLMRKTVAELKKKLAIPASYTILFTSSATECWEVIAQSLISVQSIHLFNGAFGKKWHAYTQFINPHAIPIHFPVGCRLPDHLRYDFGDTICLTQNETSNGTQISMESLRLIRKNNPHHLIAVDATSSLGGIHLDFRVADVWFASVQKCLGLPAGLALLICSPRAVKRAQQLNEQHHYNSLVNQLQMIKKFQTTHTPNVMGIYLLYRVMKKAAGIRTISKRIKRQATAWHRVIRQAGHLHLYADNPSVLSDTVITVAGPEKYVSEIMKATRKAGFLLGNGYGELKKETFRIANFPAIKENEIKGLKKFIINYK
jgi:phosphoserine aminotransferase